jgi:hypothetical protein
MAADPASNSYIPSADPGNNGGGFTMTGGKDPMQSDYESIFGPSGRDIKRDEQRSKRHQRWHLPDMLKGPNMFLTDRVDGLITDATNSPFTTVILPYVYLPNPDAKIKWNVYSFDEGLATRVPYESGARVLTQTKSSHAGYAVRQGLAITMEHNFMMSPAGRENFNNQLLQLVGSIQYTNDLDVHMALITAPSYERTMSEKYQYMDKDPSQVIRQYIDMFGIIQKNPNGLDLIIEESKQNLKKWGAKEPTFMLVNGKMCMQLNMNIERTQYMTNGYDGVKRLKEGPDMPKYRNLQVVNSRAFSLETGAPPRDLLNRRVRVAEYYHIPPRSASQLLAPGAFVEIFDVGRAQMRKISMQQIVNASKMPSDGPGDIMQLNTEWLKIITADQRNNITVSIKALQSGDGVDVRTKVQYKAEVLAYCNVAANFQLDWADKTSFWDFVLAMMTASERGLDITTPAARVTACNAIFEEEDNALYIAFAAANFTTQRIVNILATVGVLSDAVLATQGPFTNALNLRCNAWYAILSQNVNASYLMVHPMLEGAPNPFYILAFHGPHNRGGHNFNRFTVDNMHIMKSPASNSKHVNNVSVVAKITAIGVIERLIVAATIPVGLYDQVGRYLMSAGREKKYEILMVRPCIEHEMLGIILGRGGTQELGCTFWGQTELSCYDDAFHGKWGMSYKYHERAIVHNEKNLIRLWDVCFNGYTGGMGTKFMQWGAVGAMRWHESVNNVSEPYGSGDDIMCMLFEHDDTGDVTFESEMPNPVRFHGDERIGANIDPENVYQLLTADMDILNEPEYKARFDDYKKLMPNFEMLHRTRKNAGMASVEYDTHQSSLAFVGTMNVCIGNENLSFRGAGHLGDSYVGCASVRAGKGMQTVMPQTGMHLNRII